MKRSIHEELADDMELSNEDSVNDEPNLETVPPAMELSREDGANDEPHPATVPPAMELSSEDSVSDEPHPAAVPPADESSPIGLLPDDKCVYISEFLSYRDRKAWKGTSKAFYNFFNRFNYLLPSNPPYQQCRQQKAKHLGQTTEHSELIVPLPHSNRVALVEEGGIVVRALSDWQDVVCGISLADEILYQLVALDRHTLACIFESRRVQVWSIQDEPHLISEGAVKTQSSASGRGLPRRGRA